MNEYILVNCKDNGEIWEPTSHLRWFIKGDKDLLMQLWVSDKINSKGFNNQEWREVESVNP